jgi:hypothetical protein
MSTSSQTFGAPGGTSSAPEKESDRGASESGDGDVDGVGGELSGERNGDAKEQLIKLRNWAIGEILPYTQSLVSENQN